MWRSFIGGGSSASGSDDEGGQQTSTPTNQFRYVTKIAEQFLRDDASTQEEEDWKDASDEDGGWNEDDGLEDLDNFSDAQSDHAEEQDNNNNHSSSPPPSSSSLEHNHNQIQGQLDSVLHEIEEQEDETEQQQQQQNNSTDRSEQDDAAHMDQAISEIQTELLSVDVANSPKFVVDHTPLSNPLDSLENGHGADTGVGTLPEDNNTDTDNLDDDYRQDNFGPVVDVVPKAAPLNRHDSLAVQANEVALEEEDDDDDVSYETELRINLPPTLQDDHTQQQHVVDHTPEGMEHPPPPPSRTSTSLGVLASLDVNDDNDNNDEPKEYGPVVDQTPVDVVDEVTGSLAVVANELNQDIEDDEAMDETCYGDSTVEGGNLPNGEGWDDDDDASEDVPIKRATFSPQLVDTRHLVDYTPDITETARDNRDPSVIAVATIGEISKESEENHEYESEFGPVVDHTPQTPAIEDRPKNASASVENTNSMHVDPSALEQEFGEDSAMSDDSSENGWVEKEDDWEAKLEEKDTNTSEWDSKLPANADNAIVDHTPSEMGSPIKRPHGDQSVEVQAASETNTRDDDNMDENVVYGPVVDLTPTTPSAMARSDSVVVNVPENDLDTVDETTVLGGEPEHNQEADDSDDDEDKLVDRIPPRPESQYGDGSTSAAAEPSEYMSVDDFAPENQNFGPVVDVTPPTRSVVAASEQTFGEGSTAVFAPASVAADDLDPEIEQDDAEANQRSEWEEGQVTPNPQSGNDEPPNMDAVNEQLVDFLPPQNNDDEAPPDSIEDGNREGLSEMTVGGAASLLQGVDPVETDFGPVVDQIPSVSAQDLASIATQVSASECRSMAKDDKMNGGTDDASIDRVKGNVVVDRLPLTVGKRPLDSTATIGRSILSEEEEEEDASKFGPVVDQLPTSSVAPSRGGSTVDALGTVSEVPSDDEGDGWDDDFDASLGGVSSVLRLQIRSSVANSSNDADRSVSVRFEDSRSLEETSASNRKPDDEDDIPMRDDSRYYDPGEYSTSESHSQYYDPSTGWDDDSGINELNKFHDTKEAEMADKSFAEADTPPSTPYRRPTEDFEEEDRGGENGSVDLPVLPSVYPSSAVASCPECESAKTAECPCVRRLIESNLKEGSILGSMKASDGESITIDFGQMLQDEIARRRLLEVELENLKTGMEPQNLQDSLQAARQSELENEIAELRQSSEALLRKISSAESESTKLRMENVRLGDELETSQVTAANLEKSKDDTEAKGAAFIAEIESLRRSLETASQNGTSNGDIGNRLSVLQSELASKTGECTELGTKVSQLERRLADAEELTLQQAKESAEISALMKRTIASLKDQIAGSDELVMNTERARLQLEKKLRALDDEVTNLRSSSKHVAELQIQHENDLQQQYQLLDKKTTDLRALEKLVSDLQTEKAAMMADLAQQRALADQSESLANELLSVAKERDLLENSLRESKETMLSLQKLMETHGEERAALDQKLKQEKAALQSDLEEVRSALASKEQQLLGLCDDIAAIKSENDDLTNKLVESEKAKRVADVAVAETKVSLKQREEKLLKREEEIENLKDEIDSATADRKNHEQEFQRVTSQLDDARTAMEETKELLKGEEKTNLDLENTISKLRSEFDALSDERDTLKHDYDEDIAKLKEGSDCLQEEVSRLQEAEQLHAQSLREVEENARDEARQYEERKAELSSQCDGLREELSRLEASEADHMRALEELKSSAKLEIEDLRKEAAMHKELYEKADIPVQEMKSKLEELTRSHDNEISKLKQESEQLRDELASREEISTQQARSFQELKSKSEDLRAQVEQREILSKELGEEKLRLQEIIGERDNLREENEELLVQFGLLKQRMDESDEHTAALEGEIETLQRLNDDAVAAEVEALRLRTTELNSQVEAVQDEKSSLESDVLALQDQSRSLGEQCATKSAEIARLNDELAKISDLERDKAIEKQYEINTLRDEVAKLAGDADHKDAELGNLRAKLDEQQANHAKQIEELVKKSKSLAEELSSSREKAVAAETSSEAKKQVMGVLKASEEQIVKLESQLAEKDTSMSKLQVKIEELQKQVEESASATKEAASGKSKEMESLQKQIDVLSDALQNTRTRLVTKEQDVDRLSAEVRTIQSQQTKSLVEEYSNASKLLSSDVSSLRHSVISKAAKLKRSESSRADAMKRLEEERRANNESLKKLKQSIERYYAPNQQ